MPAETNDSNLNILIPSSLKDEIKGLAKLNHVSMAAYVRLVLSKDVQSHR